MGRETFSILAETKVAARRRWLAPDDAGEYAAEGFAGQLREHVRAAGRRHAWRDAMAGPVEAFRRAMRNDGAPAHRFLLDRNSTLPGAREWLREQGIPGRNRIRLRSSLTPEGDLSVVFDPAYLDSAGKWQVAHEWDLRRMGRAPVDGRPPNEVLFVRGAAALVDAPGRDPGPCDSWGMSRGFAAEAAYLAYRTVLGRLARRFHVQEDTAVVALLAEDSPHNWIVSALEVVDGHAEHMEAVTAAPGRFLDATGLDPAGFLALCEGRHLGLGHRWIAEKVSGQVRRLGGPGPFSLTATECLTWFAELERAVRYGVWDPSSPEAKASLAGLPVPAPPPPSEPDDHVRGPAVRREARAAIRRRGRAPEPRLWGAAVYPARAVELPPDLREEFGVADAHALVEQLNDLRGARGERPIPQGDYPTGKANLAKVARMLRELRDEAAPGPSPGGP